MIFRVKFKTGKTHEIDVKGSLTLNLVAGRVKLKCGAVAKGILGTKHLWYLTTEKANCEHCLKKDGKPVPKDLSNYHTFVK